MLVSYGRYVRAGGLSNREYQVRVTTVALIYRAINKTLQLEGKSSPVETKEGNYEPAISQLLEGYKRQDPPPEPKLAVPVSVPNMMYVMKQNGNERDKCVGDFGLIAFYYLLHVGEYTYHRTNQKRRTQQFRLGDVTLWHNHQRLDPNLPEDVLIRMCDSATLNISNQKNGVRAKSITQDALNRPLCPVRAIIRRINT